MPASHVGPLTTLLEGAAAAVGAGMLLGGFLTGLAGLILAWPRWRFDRRVLRYGYAGGAVGVAVMIADITFRYGG
jgi:hypothetical protein